MSDDKKQPMPWRGDGFGKVLAQYELENLRQRKRLILMRMCMSDSFADELNEGLRKQNG